MWSWFQLKLYFCVGTRAVEVAPGAETVVATGDAVVVEVSDIVAWVAVVLVSVLEGFSSLGAEPLCTYCVLPSLVVRCIILHRCRGSIDILWIGSLISSSTLVYYLPSFVTSCLLGAFLSCCLAALG